MMSRGVVPRNGPNEGAPEANAQHGRRRGSRRQQLRSKVNLPKPAVRYEPYPNARNRRVARNSRPQDWRNVPLPSYQKDFYRGNIRTAQRSSEVEDYRNVSDITVTGCDAPKPILHVDEASLSKSLTKAIKKLNSDSSLTALKAQRWPVALSGRGLVAVDHAASKWKSLAYLVPALVHAQHQLSVLDGPTVLVLTLAREVDLQVQTAVQELSKESGIRTMYILSGDPKPLQIMQLKQLKEGADICIATPGRLTAFMAEGKVKLGHCTFSAIDEVDRMLEMGFGRNLRAIADNVRPDRQTVVRLTHATKQSRELAPESTNDSVNVTVGTATQEQQNQRVGHIVFVCKKAKKKDKLAALLKDILSNDSDRAVTFVERQQTDLASTLRLQGSPEKTEQEQQGALDVPRQGTTSFLVATNVATKAMEPDNVRCVVSYDHPVHSCDLLRRLRHVALPVGTGRMYTFPAPDDHVRARELMRLFRENKQPLPPGLRKVANKSARK